MFFLMASPGNIPAEAQGIPLIGLSVAVVLGAILIFYLYFLPTFIAFGRRHPNRIFDDNLRIFLGSNGGYNPAIISTATSPDSYLFWYLNNGITITCKNYSFNKGHVNPKIKIEEFQIVNGAQTSHSLLEASRINPDALENVVLMVRIYATDRGDIAERVYGHWFVLFAARLLLARAGDSIPLGEGAKTLILEAVGLVARACSSQHKAVAHYQIFRSPKTKDKIMAELMGKQADLFDLLVAASD
jgi:hypothetical protein